MEITAMEKVFNQNVLTKGSEIKITGFSYVECKYFDGEIYEVFKCERDTLTVKKGRKKTKIEIWELDLEDVQIEMISHKCPPVLPLPF
ncbi:hypothetical protein HMPREF3291_05120 [Bacillus sp. HMSC76G11]|nr:hypothetical protein HMPREF3291_05120 [Bacillus sp. HMSC76G11]